MSYTKTWGTFFFKVFILLFQFQQHQLKTKICFLFHFSLWRNIIENLILCKNHSCWQPVTIKLVFQLKSGNWESLDCFPATDFVACPPIHRESRNIALTSGCVKSQKYFTQQRNVAVPIVLTEMPLAELPFKYLESCRLQDLAWAGYLEYEGHCK